MEDLMAAFKGPTPEELAQADALKNEAIEKLEMTIDTAYEEGVKAGRIRPSSDSEDDEARKRKKHKKKKRQKLAATEPDWPPKPSEPEWDMQDLTELYSEEDHSGGRTKKKKEKKKRPSPAHNDQAEDNAEGTGPDKEEEAARKRAEREAEAKEKEKAQLAEQERERERSRRRKERALRREAEEARKAKTHSAGDAREERRGQPQAERREERAPQRDPPRAAPRETEKGSGRTATGQAATEGTRKAAPTWDSDEEPKTPRWSPRTPREGSPVYATILKKSSAEEELRTAETALQQRTISLILQKIDGLQGSVDSLRRSVSELVELIQGERLEKIQLLNDVNLLKRDLMVAKSPVAPGARVQQNQLVRLAGPAVTPSILSKPQVGGGSKRSFAPLGDIKI
ncbi:P protein [Sierra Nevada virus]|uniref:P protein n=1 Tax=Sierra Nevada virus TaxID=1424280 RepID=A0A067YEW0_9MONO|nr:P protein [Sierra Nevada virus]AHA90830.1 P protein [Sierra Nevada virus]